MAKLQLILMLVATGPHMQVVQYASSVNKDIKT